MAPTEVMLQKGHSSYQKYHLTKMTPNKSDTSQKLHLTKLTSRNLRYWFFAVLLIPTQLGTGE